MDLNNRPMLREYYTLNYDKQTITEAVMANKPLRIKGILQRADEKNQNGRIYPRAILERESQKYLNEFVSQQGAMGELDHPESTVVNLRQVSHNVVEMHWEGNDLVGTLEILSTPNGNIVKELMKNGIRLGISSRGVGSIKELGEGTVQVDEDFSLICFDIVSNPSTKGAFLSEGLLIPNPENRFNDLLNAFFDEVGQ